MSGGGDVDNWEQRTEEQAPKPASKFKFNLAAAEFKPTAAPAAGDSAPTAAPVASAPAPAPAAEKPAAPATPEKPATPTPTPAPAAATTPSTTTAPVAAAPSPSPAGADVADADEEEVAPAAHVVDDGVHREHLNIVFIGHVDAGKSTISGHIMYLTGEVDDRTLEKFAREAKAKGRESWVFAWALDTTDQERAKGKTQEVGRATFNTATRRYTILDAPGHKSFVPHMIGGATQADVGVLVISARKGEFEAGLDRGGQTREHAMLAKTTGIKQLIIVINKMDDPTVGWDKERYDECTNKLTPLLKSVGYNMKNDVTFMPVSGFTGENLKDRVTKEVCPWYEGPSLLEFLDHIKMPERADTAPVRMIINDKYREMGTVVMGKLEAGTIRQDQKLLVMPNRMPVEVIDISSEGVEVRQTEPGDNPRIRLKGIEEEDIRPGFVLCDPSRPCNVAKEFDCQLLILEHKSIVCAGYSAIIHVQSCVEEVVIEKLLAVIDKKNPGTILQKNPKFVRPGQTVVARLSTTQPICVETFKEFPQMGRFMIRDEGKTVAAGVITKLHPLA